VSYGGYNPKCVLEANSYVCHVKSKVIDDFAREATDNIVTTRANIQGEGAGLKMSLDMEFRFDLDPRDEEVPHSHPTPQRAAREQTEDLLSTNATEASTYDRPPPIDPEDNQYKVEKLVGKRP
jgi:hypothetical protein